MIWKCNFFPLEVFCCCVCFTSFDLVYLFVSLDLRSFSGLSFQLVYWLAVTVHVPLANLSTKQCVFHTIIECITLDSISKYWSDSIGRNASEMSARVNGSANCENVMKPKKKQLTQRWSMQCVHCSRSYPWLFFYCCCCCCCNCCRCHRLFQARAHSAIRLRYRLLWCYCKWYRLLLLGLMLMRPLYLAKHAFFVPLG